MARTVVAEAHAIWLIGLPARGLASALELAPQIGRLRGDRRQPIEPREGAPGLVRSQRDLGELLQHVDVEGDRVRRRIARFVNTAPAHHRSAERYRGERG
jgi:hypothetical protein